MILISLKLSNFKQHGVLDLNFKEGLVGIVGKNGAGKSSIFEAVLFCLFGDIKLDKDYIRSSWATTKEPVSLDLVFENQGKTFQIIREFRGKAMTHHAQLFDHKKVSIATGAKPVNAAVTDLIGMDKDTFKRSIFSGQKELIEITKTKGEDRRKMIRKMVGLDKLDAIQNIIRQDKNVIKNQISGQENLLLSEEDLKANQTETKALNKAHNKLIGESEKLNKKLEADTKLYNTAQKEFEQLNKVYVLFNEIKNTIGNYQTRLEELKESETALAAEIKHLSTLKTKLKAKATAINKFEKQKKELTALDTEKAKFDQVVSIQKDIKNFELQIQEMRPKAEQLKVEIEKGEALDKKASVLHKAIQKNIQSIEKNETAVKKLMAEKGGIDSRIAERNASISNIEQLGKEADCPTCLQPLVNSYDQTLNKLKKEIAAFESKEKKQLDASINKENKAITKIKTALEAQRKEGDQLSSKMEVLKRKKEELKELQELGKEKMVAIKASKKAVKDLGTIKFDQKKYDTIKKEISQFEKEYIKLMSEQDDVNKIPEKEEKRKEVINRIKKGNESIKEKNQKLTALQFDEKSHSLALEKSNKLEAKKEEQKRLVDAKKEEISELKIKMKDVESTYNQHFNVLKSIEGQRSDFEQLEKLNGIFGKFKSFALERVKPIITTVASQLFTRITKGKYESIKVDNDFGFHIFDNGIYYPIERFSGGEVDLANLCLRIGISNAVAELSGSTAALSLLCFDEIFGSQDEGRRFEILAALEHLKEQYRQIYIISHVESVKDNFPNILQVSKSGEGSVTQWL